MSRYHAVHPVTGLEFDYEHACATCACYTERTVRKLKVIGCTMAPEVDGETFGQQRESFPACVGWWPKRKKPPTR